jgi:tetratricopeptide (TPR) repeat protein
MAAPARKRSARSWSLWACLCGVPAVVTGAFVWSTWPAPVPDVTIAQQAPSDPPPVPPAESLPEARRQLAEALERHGPEHPQVAEALMVLGRLLRDPGQKAEACQVYKQVLDIRTRVNRADHWQARESRERLAALDEPDPRARQADAAHAWAEQLHKEGKYLKAIPLCKQAVSLRRAVLGEARAVTADSLHLLGVLYLEHGDYYARAEQEVRAALRGYGASLGKDHPLYADCLARLASLADDRGDFAGAEKLYEQALAIHSTARGKLTREYARTLNRYGHLCIAWWKNFAHGKCFRALQIREQVLGKDDPDRAESLEDLGWLALNGFHFERAEGLFCRALAIRQKRQGEGHPETAEARSGLGLALLHQAEYARAHFHLRQAIRLTEAEEAGGSQHPLLARYLGNFAELIHAGYFECLRAAGLSQRSLAIRERAGLTRHPDYAGNLIKLGCSQRFHGFLKYGAEDIDLEPIETPLRKAVACFESLPGGKRLPGYPEALCILANTPYLDNYRSWRGRAQAERLLGPGDVLAGRHLVPAARVARVEQGAALLLPRRHGCSPPCAERAWRFAQRNSARASTRASSSAPPSTRSAPQAARPCQAKLSTQTCKTRIASSAARASRRVGCFPAVTKRSRIASRAEGRLARRCAREPLLSQASNRRAAPSPSSSPAGRRRGNASSPRRARASLNSRRNRPTRSASSAASQATAWTSSGGKSAGRGTSREAILAPRAEGSSLSRSASLLRPLIIANPSSAVKGNAPTPPPGREDSGG